MHVSQLFSTNYWIVKFEALQKKKFKHFLSTLEEQIVSELQLGRLLLLCTYYHSMQTLLGTVFVLKL